MKTDWVDLESITRNKRVKPRMLRNKRGTFMGETEMLMDVKGQVSMG